MKENLLQGKMLAVVAVAVVASATVVAVGLASPAALDTELISRDHTPHHTSTTPKPAPQHHT